MHPRRHRRSVAATIVAVAMLWGAGPAGAANATGCSGEASSVDDKGNAIDEAAAPGGGGTESDPFTIDPDGPVSWNGSTTGVITDGKWTVTSSLFSTSGSFDNDDKKQTSDGSKKVSDYVPSMLVLPGIYKVDVEVTGQGGTCTVAGYIEIDADPLSSPWTFAALLLLLLAVLMLFMGRPDMAAYFADVAARPASPAGPPPDISDGGAP